MHKGNIVLEFVCIEKQLADIFTKTLNVDRLCTIKREIGMLSDKVFK